MALQSVPSFIYPQQDIRASGTTIPSIAALDSVSAANAGWGIVFRAPKAGTLVRVGFYVQAVTTGATVNVAFQNVDASGLPNGVNAGGSSPTTVSVTAAGWYEANFTTGATVTAGQKIAAVVTQPATPGSMTDGRLANVVQLPIIEPYYVLNSAGSAWSKPNTGVTPLFAIGYSTSDYIHLTNASPFNAVTSTSVNTGAAVRRWGARFQVPFSCRAVGAAFWTTAQFPPDGSLVLYNDAGTALATATFTSAAAAQPSAGNGYDLYFDSGTQVTLSVAAYYRLAFTATSATSQGCYDGTVNSTGLLSALPGGPLFSLTTYNGTAWDDTQTTRYPFGLSLMIDQLSDGAGGGGGFLDGSGGYLGGLS